MTDVASLMNMAAGSADAGLPMAVERAEKRAERGFLPKLFSLIGKIPFADDLAAAWYCAKDAETPLRVKGVLLAALAYFVTPADLIPDVIIGLGFTDDATVLATALSVVGGHIQPRHKVLARQLLRKKPLETDQAD